VRLEHGHARVFGNLLRRPVVGQEVGISDIEVGAGGDEREKLRERVLHQRDAMQDPQAFKLLAPQEQRFLLQRAGALGRGIMFSNEVS